MSLRPRTLPKVRDQVLKHLTDPDAPVRALTGAHNQPGLDTLTNHLRAAGLYWVAPDMAALAMSAGGQLAAARWATADRPAPCGLIVFDGGVGQLDVHQPGIPPGSGFPVEACSWGPADGDCMVALFMSRSRLAATVAANLGGELVVEEVPPLVPLQSFILPVGAEPAPMALLAAEGAPVPVLATLAASWLLMQQPTLVDRSTVQPDKSVRRTYARLGRPDPEVTVVDLRRQYVPDRDNDGEPEGRHYKHRWVVSGHWKNVAYGPDHSLRRQQWIAAHIKGPDGAPMLKSETVNVWRR